MTTTATSTELLQALHDPCAGAWGAFVGRYRPLLEQFGQRCGLGREEARDLAQTALLEFYRSYREGRYARDRGRLRNWLFGIARHHVGRHRRPNGIMPPVGRDLDEDLASRWESAWARELLLAALSRVRSEVDPATFEAFELYALAEVPPREVAAILGMSENAVYGAKRRVLERLRIIRDELDETY